MLCFSYKYAYTHMSVLGDNVNIYLCADHDWKFENT